MPRPGRNEIRSANPAVFIRRAQSTQSAPTPVQVQGNLIWRDMTRITWRGDTIIRWKELT